MKRIIAVWHRVRTSRKLLWLPPVAIGVVYFLLQFSQLSMYGVTWDEPLHRNWGKIFALFLAKGDRTLLTLMPGHGIEYGPLYFYLNYVLSEFVYQRGWLTFVEANHLLTLITSSISVGLVFVLGRFFGGRRVGYLSALFFALFPQFVAHAHYNPKDIPLMTVILCTVLVFVMALRRVSPALLVLSGFLFGLCMAVKINAVLMAPVFGITYIWWLLAQWRTSALPSFLRVHGITIVLTMIACVIGLYLFWPSAWGDLLLIPRSIAFFAGPDFWPGKVLFFGHSYTGVALPWYYTLFEYITAMPMLMLLAWLIGLAALIRRFLRDKTPLNFFLLLWIVFPLLFSMKPDLVRYDGIRQFFFILPAIAVAAAFGLDALVRLLERRAKKPSAKILFLALVTVSLLSQVLSLHPFEGSYRNELLRMLYQENLDQQFHIEYWGATYKQGMNWLVDNAEPNPVICVPTAGILVTWYPWREDFSFECSDATKYVMFFTRYGESKKYEELKDPTFAIRRMNSALLLIYKVK